MPRDSDAPAAADTALCHVCGAEPATVSWEAGDEYRLLCERCTDQVSRIMRRMPRRIKVTIVPRAEPQMIRATVTFGRPK